MLFLLYITFIPFIFPSKKWEKIFNSQLKWCHSIFFPRIFVLDMFQEQIADFKMTIFKMTIFSSIRCKWMNNLDELLWPFFHIRIAWNTIQQLVVSCRLRNNACLCLFNWKITPFYYLLCQIAWNFYYLVWVWINNKYIYKLCE